MSRIPKHWHRALEIIIPVSANAEVWISGRCCTEALGRKGDPAGINDWCRKILSAANRKQAAIETVSNGFLHSPEFVNRKTTDEQYVTILYRTFLGRDPDTAGYNGWVNRLKSGISRDSVMMGFAYSKEFADLMTKYGIK